MIWEFIAIISAGLGAAGIVLLARIFFKRLPKWLLPASAGLGMLLFQIYSEYSWFGHTRTLLPEGTVVVAEVPESAFYKPWSYYRPQVLKFIAADSNTIEIIDADIPVIQTNLYFFERRMSANTLPVWINCQTQMAALMLPDTDTQNINWQKTDFSSRTAAAVCPKTS